MKSPSQRHLLTFSFSFDGSPVSPVDSINILGLHINKNFFWKPHITVVAKVASKKLGVLFRLREFFFFFTVTPIIQGSHPPLYGVLLSYLGWLRFNPFLDRVESKAKGLINSSALFNSPDYLSL